MNVSAAFHKQCPDHYQRERQFARLESTRYSRKVRIKYSSERTESFEVANSFGSSPTSRVAFSGLTDKCARLWLKTADFLSACASIALTSLLPNTAAMLEVT